MRSLITLLLLLVSTQLNADNLYYANQCSSYAESSSYTTSTVNVTHDCLDPYGASLGSGQCTYTVLVDYGHNRYFPCPYGADWSGYDVDGDGVSNGADSDPYDGSSGNTGPDSDGDGTPDDSDPCPNDPWDECANNDGDRDGDGQPDNTDPCPDDPNDQCGPSDPGPGVECTGYTPSGDTVAQIWSDVGDQLQAAPVVSSVSNFFTVAASGVCPVWQMPIWESSVTIDFQCSDSMAFIMAVVSVVLFLGASYVAFRWAFL